MNDVRCWGECRQREAAGGSVLHSLPKQEREGGGRVRMREAHIVCYRLKRRNTRQQPLQECMKVLGYIVVCSVSCHVNIYCSVSHDPVKNM